MATEEKLTHIAQNFLDRNKTGDVCDVTVVKTAAIDALSKFLIQSVKLKDDDFTTEVDTLDPVSNTHDLYLTVSSLKRLSLKEKQQFDELFGDAIVF